jgi:hypothetical protein
VALDFGLDYARRHGLAVRVVAAQPLHTERDHISHKALAKEVHGREGDQDAEILHVEGHPAEQLPPPMDS